MDTGRKLLTLRKKILVHGYIILVSKNTLCHGLTKNRGQLDNKAIAAEYSVEILVIFGRCFANWQLSSLLKNRDSWTSNLPSQKCLISLSWGEETSVLSNTSPGDSEDWPGLGTPEPGFIAWVGRPKVGGGTAWFRILFIFLTFFKCLF